MPSCNGINMTKDADFIAEKPESISEAGDGLSVLLQRLKLTAKVFLRADFCGDWAVDTSGERHMPFHLITRGTGWLHQPGAEPRAMTTGDLVLFPGDAAHTISSSASDASPGVVNLPATGEQTEPVTGLMCGYFSFDVRAAAPLLDGLPDCIALPLGDTARHHDTATLVQLWLSEAASVAPGVDAAIDRLAYVVFIHVLRDQIASGTVSGPLLGLADTRIGPVLNRIHADPGSVSSVDMMAELANMSRTAFRDQFKAIVGRTPGRYLNHWRMQLAIDLLTSSDLPIAAIAERCGYSSEVAFRKAFRTTVGEPPGKVRRSPG